MVRFSTLVQHWNNITHANALMQRLIKQSGWFSGRSAVRMSVALGLITLAVGVQGTLNAPNGLTNVVELWPTCFMALSLPLALLAVAVAVAFVVRDVVTEQYQLLCLTSMSNVAIVIGYIIAVLHRLRGLLLLVIGFMPLFIIGSLLFISDSWAQCAYSQAYMDCSVMPQVFGLPAWGLSLSGYTVGLLEITAWLWGIILLGVVAGVAVALWQRSAMRAIIIASSLIFVVIGLAGILPYPALFYGVYWLILPPWTPFPSSLAGLTVLVVLTYVLIVGIAVWSRRWVRKSG